MRKLPAASVVASLALVACGRHQARPIRRNPSRGVIPPRMEKVGDHLRAAPSPIARPSRAHASPPSPSSRRGLDFAHQWTPPPGYKLDVYSSLPGGGVCVGDYDGDDLPDVFLTQPHVGAKLYRNLGGFRFEETTAAAGISAGMQALGPNFIDIDNDNDLDLYVCRKGEPNQLYINQGNGTFREEAARRGFAFTWGQCHGRLRRL